MQAESPPLWCRGLTPTFCTGGQQGCCREGPQRWRHGLGGDTPSQDGVEEVGNQHRPGRWDSGDLEWQTEVERQPLGPHPPSSLLWVDFFLSFSSSNTWVFLIFPFK